MLPKHAACIHARIARTYVSSLSDPSSAWHCAWHLGVLLCVCTVMVIEFRGRMNPESSSGAGAGWKSNCLRIDDEGIKNRLFIWRRDGRNPEL